MREIGDASVVTRRDLAELGFRGFVTFRELAADRLSTVPAHGGVYAVLRESDEPPEFLEANPGGRFKGRDPTVPIGTLAAKWVGETHVVYFGKANSLPTRLRQFVDFGLGKPIGHWGGRYIWQLEGARDFVVAWKPAESGADPLLLEAELVQTFRERYGAAPFANLT